MTPTSNAVFNKVIYSLNAYYLMILQCIINYVAVCSGTGAAIRCR